MEAELIDSADIFTDVENSVPAAEGGVVVAEDIIGKSDARADAGGDAVVEGGTGGVAGKAGDASLPTHFG